MTTHDKVLFDRQALENTSPLKHLNYAHFDDIKWLAFGNVNTIKSDRSSCQLATFGCKQTRNGLESGGFARAVGTQQGSDRAWFGRQRDALEHKNNPVVYHFDIV